ncbi:MAG: hypothetical protein NZ949_00625 [Candidatus Kapabacteria bacterium]|nr:hypothetical protein [Candidatus Kapabacteria bacterium]MDW7997576.1 hypothetical protein [Bacteroidota bacterium]
MCGFVILAGELCVLPAFASVTDLLRRHSTRGNDHLLGFVGNAVLLYSTPGHRPAHALWLRPDSVWTPDRIAALLADTTFLPRISLPAPKPTILGVWNTVQRSTEIALRRWEGKSWGPPEPLGSVNSPAWEGHPAVSPDGQWLVFASDRPGGWGGLDLYASRRSPDGEWEAPENLGPQLNTAADEAMPWFLPDGRLLFASRGYTLDVRWKLVSARLTLPGAWERDAILPPPFASDDNDISPIIWHDTLLLASDRRGGRGGYDLYAFQLCGPVIILLQLKPLPAEPPRGSLTVLSKGDTLLRTSAAAEHRLVVKGFQPLTVQYAAPCRSTFEHNFYAPCDFSHSVLYQLMLPLPGPPPIVQFTFQAPHTQGHTLPTAEHTWAQTLKTSYYLRSTPPLDESPPGWDTPEVRATERFLDSLAEYLYHRMSQPGCFPSDGLSVEVIGSAVPTTSVPYTGPPITVLNTAILPGTTLTAQTVALLRAYTAAIELQRRLPPSLPLNWRIAGEPQPDGSTILVRIRTSLD